MASIRKLIFAKMFYATVVFFLECRTHSGISNFLLQLPVRLFIRPTQMQARIIVDRFVLFCFEQLIGKSIWIITFLSEGFVLL